MPDTTLPAPVVHHETCAVGQASDGCRACVTACPFVAIDVRDRPGGIEVRIDADRCQRCGLCSSICPTSSIERAFDPDGLLVAAILDAASHQPDVLVLSGAHSDAMRAIGSAPVVTARSALVFDEVHILTALLGGAARVVVLADESLAPSSERLAEVAATAQVMLGASDRVIVMNGGVPWPEAVVEVADVAGPSLGPIEQDALRAARSKRDRLATLVTALGPTRSVEHVADGYGEVSIDDEACILCGACAVSCPTDALVLDPGRAALSVRDLDCVGCSACVAACPVGVVTLHGRVPAGAAALERRELVVDDSVPCRSCGEHFAPKRLLDHSRAVLVDAGLDPFDPRFQYGICGTCRDPALAKPPPATPPRVESGSESCRGSGACGTAVSGDGVFLGDVPGTGYVPVGVPTVNRRSFLKTAGVAAVGAAAAAPVLGASQKAEARVTPGRMGMVIDLERCIGCHACTASCKAENNVPLGVYRDWVEEHVLGEYPDARPVFLPKLCNHCDDPGCLRACPTGAINKRADGIVDLNSSICIACQACMQGCPYGMTFYNGARHTADKCNLCVHRIDEGLDPACVDVCPSKCRIVGDFDDPESPVSVYLRNRPSVVLREEFGLGPNIRYVGLPGELAR